MAEFAASSEPPVALPRASPELLSSCPAESVAGEHADGNASKITAIGKN
jgi:hypothetical protein